MVATKWVALSLTFLKISQPLVRFSLLWFLTRVVATVLIVDLTPRTSMPSTKTPQLLARTSRFVKRKRETVGLFFVELGNKREVSPSTGWLLACLRFFFGLRRDDPSILLLFATLPFNVHGDLSPLCRVACRLQITFDKQGS
jgi:hypothetical protein